MSIKLRNHQEDGKAFIQKSKNLGVMLWHEMGLGKTLLSLIYCRERLAELKLSGVSTPKFMVILPKSAITTWQDECNKCTPEIFRDMLLIPYSQLNKAPKLMLYYDIRIIIMDESHYLKSPETLRAEEAAKMLVALHESKGGFIGGKMIALSGTPMLNHAAELYTSWSMLGSPNCAEAAKRLIDAERYKKWGDTFCGKKEKRWDTRTGIIDPKTGKPVLKEKQGSVFEGVANDQHLQQLLQPIVHYRRAVDCLDMPGKKEIHIDLKLPDDKLLEDADIEEPEAYMALLERLARAKTPHALTWIESFLRQSTEQLVVFASYKFPIKEIQEKFPGQVVLVTGEETGNERKANIKAFQSGKVRIIAMTYRAGAESLNLQTACNALFLGWPWTDKGLKQAIARIWRGGQLRFCYLYFLTSGFNDSRILTLIRKKEEATNIVEDNLLKGSSNILSLDMFI